jgi:acetylornithine deacetylase
MGFEDAAVTRTLTTRQWIDRLVAFDTTSRNSNLNLIEEVRDWLKGRGIESWLAHNPERTKANLFATLPAQDGSTHGGIVLSGHTDVVPVDGQTWDSDPFSVVERNGSLFGRGTCDMKGFIAATLAMVPEFETQARRKPIHLAFSYDEEVGCMGAPVMLAEFADRGIRPEGCVVGEPTSMQVVVAHKGINVFHCKVHGRAAHSSLTPMGSNAIEYAARLICHIRDLADAYQTKGPFDNFYDVPYTTMTTNLIKGGIALNTIPDLCEFSYEFRNLPDMNPVEIQATVTKYVSEHLLPRMQKEYPEARIDIVDGGAAPGLDATEQAAMTQLARALTQDRATRKVAYGTEAGLFQAMNIPTVVCGPGSINNAHRPNEYVPLEQLEQCEGFLRKLGMALTEEKD